MARGTAEGVRDNLILEIRRGALVLAVLAALEEEQYGYSLKSLLAAKGVEIDEGTLYPLMRRLETQELLGSRWVLSDGRPRRYYKLTAAGARILKDLTEEWRLMSKSLDRLLQ